ncbi:MAG: glycosyltransferase family protein, partial [Verrucomicrobiota bacterium]
MSQPSLKFVFIVQGEGRGHLTQAIVLENLLRAQGHEVIEVLVGKSPRRRIPQFFEDNIKAHIRGFSSPNFVVDEMRRGIRIGPTIFYNLLRMPRFWRSILVIDRAVRRAKPDVVVNFFDFLAGFYYALFNPRPALACIGHQYLLNHPDFEFPKGKWLDTWLIKRAAQLTAARSKKNLALSFREMPEFEPQRIVPVPPLLRRKVKRQQPERGNHLLAYIVNDGYAEELIAWQEKHPEVEIHGFWDRKGVPDPYVLNKNLRFHQINEDKFIEMMRRARGYMTTAGFESVCEAMYLGKPILMVPTAGHFEQRCNAIDAAKAGAGIWDERFDVDRFLAYLAGHETDAAPFRAWVDSAGDRILPLLESVALLSRKTK